MFSDNHWFSLSWSDFITGIKGDQVDHCLIRKLFNSVVLTRKNCYQVLEIVILLKSLKTKSKISVRHQICYRKQLSRPHEFYYFLFFLCELIKRLFFLRPSLYKVSKMTYSWKSISTFRSIYKWETNGRLPFLF